MAMPDPLGMIESVRRHHDAYERGDWDAALAVLHPEVEFVWVDVGALSGTYHGHDGIAAVLGDWIRAWERDSIRFRADQMVVAGDMVIARGVQIARGRASGVEVTLPATQVFSFGADGLVRELVTAPQAEAVLAAAGVELPANVQAILDAEVGRAAGDLPRALAIFAEDVAWHGLEHGPLKGPYRGVQGVVGFHQEWDSAWEDHERRLELVIDCGDRVVTESFQSGRSHGLPVDRVDRGCWWFRDGKVVRVRFFDSLEEALSAPG